MEIPMIFISLKSLTQKPISHLKFSQFFTITRKVFKYSQSMSMTNLSTAHSQYHNNKREKLKENIPTIKLSIKCSPVWGLKTPVMCPEVPRCPNSSSARRGWKLYGLPGGLRMMSRLFIFRQNIKFTSESFRSAVSDWSWITFYHSIGISAFCPI